MGLFDFDSPFLPSVQGDTSSKPLPAPPTFLQGVGDAFSALGTSVRQGLDAAGPGIIGSPLGSGLAPLFESRDFEKDQQNEGFNRFFSAHGMHNESVGDNIKDFLLGAIPPGQAYVMGKEFFGPNKEFTSQDVQKLKEDTWGIPDTQGVEKGGWVGAAADAVNNLIWGANPEVAKFREQSQGDFDHFMKNSFIPMFENYIINSGNVAANPYSPGVSDPNQPQKQLANSYQQLLQYMGIDSPEAAQILSGISKGIIDFAPGTVQFLGDMMFDPVRSSSELVRSPVDFLQGLQRMEELGGPQNMSPEDRVALGSNGLQTLLFFLPMLKGHGALKGENIGIENNRPPSEISEAGTASQAIEGRDQRSIQATQETGALATPEIQANQGIQGKNVSATNPNALLEQAKANASRAGYQVTDSHDVNTGWLLPDGSSIHVPEEATHSDVAESAVGLNNYINSTPFRDGWVRVRNSPLGEGDYDTNIEAPTLNNKTKSVVENYLTSKANQNGTIFLDVNDPKTGRTKSYDFTYDDFKGNDFDIKKTIAASKSLTWKPGEVPEQSDISRAQFGMGGDPYWSRAALVDSGDIKAAEQSLEKTGNNTNGLISRIRLGPIDEGVRGRFEILNPNVIKVDPDHMRDTQSHYLAWRQRVNDFINNPPADIDPARLQIIRDQAIQTLKDLRTNLSPSKMLEDITNHEAIHAQIADMADGGPAPMGGATGATLRFMRLLDSTPEGKAWLDDSRAKGMDGQISALREVNNKIPDDASLQGINSWLLNRLTPDSVSAIRDAASQLEEYFNYQLNRYQETNTHPYILQSGEEAYAHSFWNPEETQANARLAGAWWERYGPSSESPIAGSRPGITGDATASSRLASAAQESPERPAGTPGGNINTTSADQARLTPEGVAQRISDITEAKASDLLSSFSDQKVAKAKSMQESVDDMMAATQRLSDALNSYAHQTYNKLADNILFEEKSGNSQPLMDRAIAVRDTRNALNRAIMNGAPPDVVLKLQKPYQMALAKFKRAFDFNASEVGKQLTKPVAESPIQKETRTVYNNSINRGIDPQDRAREIASKTLGVSVEDVKQIILDAQNGIFRDDPKLDPRNWDGAFRGLLAGKADNIVRQEAEVHSDALLGVGNTPVEHILEPHVQLADLGKMLDQGVSAFSKEVSQIDADIANTKATMPTGHPDRNKALRALAKQKNEAIARWRVEQSKITRMIRSHPDVRDSIMHSGENVDASAVAANTKVSPTDAIAKVADDTATTAAMTDDEIKNETEGLNEIINRQPRDPSGMNGDGGDNRPPVKGLKFFGDNYNAFRSDLKSRGGVYTELADTAHDFLRAMAEHLDPSRNTFHPSQWFRSFWENLYGIDHRVNQMTNLLKQIGKDKDEGFSRRVLRPIEYIESDPARAMQMLTELPEDEAVLSRFLHEVWSTTGKILSDPQRAIFDQYVEDFVPHVVQELPDGTKIDPKKPGAFTKFSDHQLGRVRDQILSQPIFKTIDDLESQGYKVMTDLPELMNAHLRSTFRAMRNREMLNYFQHAIFDNGKDLKGPAIIGDHYWREIQKDKRYSGIDFNNYTDAIRFGQGRKVFKGFYVQKELASEIEKLASVDEIPGIGNKAARLMTTGSSMYKFVRFAINPIHAFNVWSNIASVTDRTPVGALNPLMVNRIWSRANRAMTADDRSLTFNLLHPMERSRERAIYNDIGKSEAAVQNIQKALADAKSYASDHPRSKRAPALMDDLSRELDNLNKLRETYNQMSSIRDRSSLSSMMGKGLVPDRDINVAADLGLIDRITNKLPGFNVWHHWMWHDMVWKGQLGTALELRDQFIKRAASDIHGIKTKSAIDAEKVLTPEEIDVAERQAVYWAKTATGLLNKMDMSLNMQLWGRATMLSAPWTLGQLRSVRDVAGSNVVTAKLGRRDLRPFSTDMAEAGFGEKQTKFFDDLHSAMARRMILGGTAKLLASSFIASSLGSYLLTGNMQTPVQNFMVDPLHTFDVRVGTDPATHKPIWASVPLYGAQRELSQYILAGIKAHQEQKDIWTQATAPFIRFSGKGNPMLKLAIEEVTGNELGRWMYGWDDSSLQNDNDIQALTHALDRAGAPEQLNGLYDRMIYALRTLAPETGLPPSVAIKRNPDGTPVTDERGNPIALTDPRSLLTDFTGSFGPSVLDSIGILSSGLGAPWPPAETNLNAENLKTLGLYALGSQVTSSSSVDQAIASQQKQNATAERSDLSNQLVIAAKKGDWARVAQIKDQLQLTNGQTVEMVMYGTSNNAGGGGGGSRYTPGLISGGTKGTAASPELDGYVLSPDEADRYDELVGNRNLYTIQQLQKDPAFKSANNTEKATMMNAYLRYSDKLSKAQFEQELGLKEGQPIDNKTFVKAMNEFQSSRENVMAALFFNDQYRNASASERQRMLNDYMNYAGDLAYQKSFGDLKNINENQFKQMVQVSTIADFETRNYLKGTDFFQNSDLPVQQQMLKSYGDLTRKMNMNVYTGKARNINPNQISTYMRAVINTEESAKYLLHSTDMYQTASLAEQQRLDTRYENLSRTLADKDWREGTPLTEIKNIEDAYSAGPEQLMVGHLMADQAFTDLQNQYGGKDTITAYSQQLSEMKKYIKENVDATPKQLSYLQKAIEYQFLQANPQYAEYLKARTAFERQTNVGRLYLALNADEQALAGSDLGVIDPNAGIQDITDPEAVSDYFS